MNVIFEIINHYVFADSYDAKFKQALEGLAKRVAETIRPADRPPDEATVYCREIFKVHLLL